MAIQHITFDSKEVIQKTLAILKNDKKVTDAEIKDLERLREKRNRISEKLEEIEKQCHINQVSEREYQKIKKQYDFDICELDLEILRRNGDINHRKLYAKRLELLDLIMKFPIEQRSIALGNLKLSIDELYKELIKNIVKENTEQLHLKQQIIRLKLLYNKDKEVDNRHKFYVSEDEGIGLEDNLYDLHNEIESSKNIVINLEEINFSNLKIEDFLEIDATKIYDKLFSEEKTKKGK